VNAIGIILAISYCWKAKRKCPLCLLHAILTWGTFAFKELCLQAVVPIRIKAGRSGQVANLIRHGACTKYAYYSKLAERRM
jgi:hypothetical protein